MNPEEFIVHVEDSITRAVKGESNLDEEVLKINGFSTPTMRHLFNNLCSIAGTLYCEVGLYAGATFCAALCNNPIFAIGYEDFSQPFGIENIREQLVKNLSRFPPQQVIHQNFFKQDCPYYDIDIFYYDGEHDYDSQRKALPFLLPNLSRTFLYIVDDFNWKPVLHGTADSILDSKIKIIKTWGLNGDMMHDDPIWHNGIFMAVCTK